MTTPHVTELPRRLEPVEPDPFIATLPAPVPEPPRNAQAPRTD